MNVKRKYLEPVNGTAREERWEFPESVPEGLTTGRESKYHMKLFPHSLHKQHPQGCRASIRLNSMNQNIYCTDAVLNTYIKIVYFVLLLN